MLKGKKGFTLIELMIVVAIIGILAAIAIPNFLKFQAKSKQSEAKTNLKGIYTAETGYFGEANSYNSFDMVNWSPVGTARYKYDIGAAGTLPTGVTAGSVTTAGNTVPTVTAAVAFDGQGFTAGAAGNVDNDTDEDQWMVNDANQLSNIHNDID
jgi:type IV pilus assembly protein PilA